MGLLPGFGMTAGWERREKREIKARMNRHISFQLEADGAEAVMAAWYIP